MVGTKERERMYGIRDGGIPWILVRRGMNGIDMDGWREGKKEGRSASKSTQRISIL